MLRLYCQFSFKFVLGDLEGNLAANLDQPQMPSLSGMSLSGQLPFGFGEAMPSVLQSPTGATPALPTLPPLGDGATTTKYSYDLKTPQRMHAENI